jgi:hypothetical protein
MSNTGSAHGKAVLEIDQLETIIAYDGHVCLQIKTE